jgi:hypothetical protein
MNRLMASSIAVLTLGAGALVLHGGSASAVDQVSASTLQQHRSFGTIARGSTVCVGPLSPGQNPAGDTPGVQIFGHVSGSTNVTWQVFQVSSQSAPLLVFQTTATFVDKTIPPNGSFLFHACVVKSAQSAQDYDLSLNSFPVE